MQHFELTCIISVAGLDGAMQRNDKQEAWRLFATAMHLEILRYSAFDVL